jgi:hypothetical protein
MTKSELQAVLLKLSEIFAEDLSRFCWLDYFVDYAKAFDKLLDVLMLPQKAQEEAIEVIKEFIASRQREPGKWKDAGWLAYMLGQVIERARKRQRRTRQKPSADDELPF